MITAPKRRVLCCSHACCRFLSLFRFSVSPFSIPLPRSRRPALSLRPGRFVVSSQSVTLKGENAGLPSSLISVFSCFGDCGCLGGDFDDLGQTYLSSTSCICQLLLPTEKYILDGRTRPLKQTTQQAGETGAGVFSLVLLPKYHVSFCVFLMA